MRIAVDWLLDAVLPRDITQLRIFAPEAIHHEHFLADLEVLSVSRPAFKELAAHLPGTRSTLTGIMRSRGIDPGALDR